MGVCSSRSTTSHADRRLSVNQNFADKKRLFKVLVLGDSGVGKTCFSETYTNNSFSEKHKPTIGADFTVKEISLERKLITLQIWDTAGQERFASLGIAFYRGADVCMLVFDLTNKESFDNLNKWQQEFLVQAGVDIEGNKKDLTEERKVQNHEIREFVENNNNIPYYEVSAKDKDNLEAAFFQGAKLALKYQENDFDNILTLG